MILWSNGNDNKKMKYVLKIFIVIVIICIAILCFDFVSYPSEPIYELEDVSEYIIEPPCSKHEEMAKYYTSEYTDSESDKICNSRRNITIRKYFLYKIRQVTIKNCSKWQNGKKLFL